MLLLSQNKNENSTAGNKRYKRQIDFDVSADQDIELELKRVSPKTRRKPRKNRPPRRQKKKGPIRNSSKKINLDRMKKKQNLGTQNKSKKEIYGLDGRYSLN